MVKCPKCGNEVKKGNFCGKCGTKISQNNGEDLLDETNSSSLHKSPCPKCGALVKDDSIFCDKCGINIVDYNNSNDKTETGRPTKFCSTCGEKIDINAEICPKCGVRSIIVNKKNPAIAAILSFFITGLGQVYNGQIKKALILFISMVISAFLVIILIGVFLALIIWAYGIYDAYKSAQEINNGRI